MRLLSRDNRVLWVNSIGYRTPTVSKADARRALKKLLAVTDRIRQVEPNIFVLSPLAIPAYGKASIRAMNRHLLRYQVKRAMRSLGFSKPINWVFNPPAAVVAGTLGEDKLIYYCVDEYKEFTGVSGQVMADFENQLLRKANLSIVTSERLLQSRSKINPDAVLVRHGVDFSHFRKALDEETLVPAEVRDLPRPIIGFFGLIADWVDVDLIAEVAKHFATGSVVLLGKATTDVSILESLSNVHMLGRRSYDDLPGYCKAFDVALMPFRINELTLNANPLKVREYLAAGLPVVSTPIPEVEVLGLCRIAEGAPATIKEIGEALLDPGPSIARSDQVRGESWEARLDEIRSHLARVS
ncbi:MAG TPA: glycosyltransferase [Pyrinomonadaceae bacterium]|nr:glycosyltransferase [Pyrinomonadaceae bacterium]